MLITLKHAYNNPCESVYSNPKPKEQRDPKYYEIRFTISEPKGVDPLFSHSEIRKFKEGFENQIINKIFKAGKGYSRNGDYGEDFIAVNSRHACVLLDAILEIHLATVDKIIDKQLVIDGESFKKTMVDLYEDEFLTKEQVNTYFSKFKIDTKINFDGWGHVFLCVCS